MLNLHPNFLDTLRHNEAAIVLILFVRVKLSSSTTHCIDCHCLDVCREQTTADSKGWGTSMLDCMAIKQPSNVQGFLFSAKPHLHNFIEPGEAFRNMETEMVNGYPRGPDLETCTNDLVRQTVAKLFHIPSQVVADTNYNYA